eukprot:111248-Chlamydomonas_euryale.AAC.1
MEGAGVQCGQTTSDLPCPHAVGAWQVDALLTGCRKASSIGPAPTRPGSVPFLTGQIQANAVFTGVAARFTRAR